MYLVRILTSECSHIGISGLYYMICFPKYSLVGTTPLLVPPFKKCNLLGGLPGPCLFSFPWQLSGLHLLEVLNRCVRSTCWGATGTTHPLKPAYWEPPVPRGARWARVSSGIWPQSCRDLMASGQCAWETHTHTSTDAQSPEALYIPSSFFQPLCSCPPTWHFSSDFNFQQSMQYAKAWRDKLLGQS